MTRSWPSLPAPRQAVPLLGKGPKPATPVETKRVAGLLADLDSTAFSKRQSATKELEKLGGQAEPARRKVLEGRLALEFRRRLEVFLKASELRHNLSAERSLEVLERAGAEEGGRCCRR